MVTTLPNWSTTLTLTVPSELARLRVGGSGWAVNASFAAAAGVMVKLLLVVGGEAGVGGGEGVAGAGLVDERPVKVATPATAATVVVPERVAPPGLVPIARVTLLVSVVTRLPNCVDDVDLDRCRARRRRCASEGWAAICELGGGGGVMVKLVVVVGGEAGVGGGEGVAVPVLSTERPVKVATPATAATVLVPERVAPPGWCRSRG